MTWEIKCALIFWHALKNPASFIAQDRDIFLIKTHGFATGRLYSPPRAVWGMFIMNAHTLFDYFWTVEKENVHLLPF